MFFRYSKEKAELDLIEERLAVVEGEKAVIVEEQQREEARVSDKNFIINISGHGHFLVEEYQDRGDQDEASRHHSPAGVETVQGPAGAEQEKEEGEKEIKHYFNIILLNVDWRVLLVILINQTLTESVVISLRCPACVILTLTRPATLSVNNLMTQGSVITLVTKPRTVSSPVFPARHKTS